MELTGFSRAGKVNNKYWSLIPMSQEKTYGKEITERGKER